MHEERWKSPLHETVSTTATDFWNDSCAADELTYAIEHGAVGATTNPTIVLGVLRKEMPRWRDTIRGLIADDPKACEVSLTWRLIEAMAVEGAQALAPVFEREGGAKGRLSAQTNPTFYRDPERMCAHAVRLGSLAPNMQVKIPATAAGVAAIEEATRQGVNVNATVCFSVSQALAVAEAVERGLDRREAEGLPVADMSPVCTIMVGRVDDWMHALAARDGVTADPGALHWAGVAVFKEAYRLFQARGYRARLLAAAYRHHLHWSELIGGDVILTIPGGWQRRFNASAVEVRARMHEPVDPQIIQELRARFDDFGRAYDEDGMTEAEFDTYGATVRTLRGFISSYHELIALVRDLMLPDPDVA
jgi:transaldolase